MTNSNIKKSQIKKYNKEELVEAAKDMRALDLISIHAARSGHPGGTLSIMDIAAVLYLNEANIDPQNPDMENRDRIFFSAGHKAPAIYVALSKVGLVPEEDVVTLRKLNSPCQGHPHAPHLPGVEVSSGSLGQGLGIAVGSALTAKLDNKDHRVYCIMGDGEQDEGSIWEAAMACAHYKLDNLCAIIDKNRLQIDGWIKDIMDINPLADKYKAFNWNVITIDGHNIDEILSAFKQARDYKGKPTLIIANTIKGKGVSFMEDIAGWHGVSTKDREELDKALMDIGSKKYSKELVDQYLNKANEYQNNIDLKIKEELPESPQGYWWNIQNVMKADLEPTRFGFGRTLEKIGNDERIVTLHADISNSIKISDFEKNNPERLNRVFSVGIAEQNMMSVAAGFAKEGKIPITGTYGVFASGRPWDQIRTTICYDNLNVKIAGAHSGVSVGQDGATHQALEEISIMSVLPNMNLFVPCDSIETEKLSEIAILDVNGPAYIRFAREATPVITNKDTPCKYGKANIIRFRKETPVFKDAFEICLSDNYKNENEDITLIACGPIVAEAMRAAYILKKEIGVESRIINIHTIKPLDINSLILAAAETGVIITCEEHQLGGFGNIIAGNIIKRKEFNDPLLFDMIGVEDRFGESGNPWELMIRFKLTAEHIVEKAKVLLLKKKR